MSKKKWKRLLGRVFEQESSQIREQHPKSRFQLGSKVRDQILGAGAENTVLRADTGFLQIVPKKVGDSGNEVLLGLKFAISCDLCSTTSI